MMKYHHRCSSSKRLYTYSTIDVPSGPRTRRATEERRIRIPTLVERRRAMVENSKPGADSKQGESAIVRRRRGREIVWVGKRGCTPPYIGQGGMPSSSPPPCGTKPPRGGSAPAKGGWAPPLGAKPKGVKPPPPLMGSYGPLSLFPLF